MRRPTPISTLRHLQPWVGLLAWASLAGCTTPTNDLGMAPDATATETVFATDDAMSDTVEAPATVDVAAFDGELGDAEAPTADDAGDVSDADQAEDVSDADQAEDVSDADQAVKASPDTDASSGDGDGDVTSDAGDSDDADTLDAIPTDCAGLDDGTLCDDGDPCTLDDGCVAEACVGAAMDCSDQDPCTVDEVCVDGTCKSNTLEEGKPCDGANGCTFDGACSLGVCEPFEPLCDDGGACKVGACVDEVCVYEDAPNYSSCDDADACTTFDRCFSGFCLGSPKSCQDGEPCTLDSCEAETGDCLSEEVEGCVPGTPTDFTEEDVNPYSATYEDDLTLASFADKLLLVIFHSPS